MKQVIAIPTSNNCLCQHFGHCEKFAVFQVEDKVIQGETYITPPPHQPGVLPIWLASKGVTHVIAGGIGHKAIALFHDKGIQVFTGAGEVPAKMLIEDFVNGSLKTGSNSCDH
ncbi:MAG: ATPase [Bacteroidales bacterium]|nr:ATPase [Bacteroidales bacterium]